MSKYYAVLTLHPGTGTSAEIQDYTFKIFKGKTARSAINRAKDHILDDTPLSRADYEAEHGEVSDDKFLEELHKGGFIIKLAKFEKY